MNSPPVAGLPAFVIVAENVCVMLVIAEVGETALAVRSDKTALTATELEQFTVVEFPPEVIITEAVFVPLVVYVLETETVAPESPSVPLHEYVYEPVPPEGTAVHVAELSTYILVGETEHDPETGASITVTAVEALTEEGGDVTWHEYSSVVMPHPGPIVFILQVEGGDVHDLP